MSVTEVRLFAAALPLTAVKEQHRAPLGMLYEQKRAIKVRIKKNAAAGEGSGLKKPAGGIGLLKKPVALGKIGGGSKEGKREEEVVVKVEEKVPEKEEVKVEQKKEELFEFFGGGKQEEEAAKEKK